MSFRKAERKKAKLRLALCGPSGSGKTYSALLVAQGLAPEGRIALIDTERGSGELYSSLTAYDVATLTPPFTPNRYIELIRKAEEAGYAVLIIDSLSHAWTGEGGVLDMHDKATAASKSGNGFVSWREVTPHHNALIDTIINADLHLIATMRTKTAYDILDDGNGKKAARQGWLGPGSTRWDGIRVHRCAGSQRRGPRCYRHEGQNQPVRWAAFRSHPRHWRDPTAVAREWQRPPGSQPRVA